MVIKKKGLYLGLLLPLLGIGNVIQAYDVRTYDVQNKTPYMVRFRIDYYGKNCKNDVVRVYANKSKTIRANLKLCPVRQWAAFVYDSGPAPTRVGPIEYTKEDSLKFVIKKLIVERSYSLKMVPEPYFIPRSK